MDNSEQSYKSTTPACSVSLDSLSPTELWTLSILKSQGFASLSELARHYAKAKDQTVSKESARHYLYRVLQHLEAKGLVELYFDDSRLLTARLKCVPIFYRNSPDGDERKFDLSHLSRGSENLVIRQASAKKIQVKPSDLNLRITKWTGFGQASKFRALRYVHAKVSLKALRKVGLRFVRRLSDERYEALSEVSGFTSIVEKSTTHYDLDYLFSNYEKRIRESVIALWDGEEGKYIVFPARSRFTDPKLLKDYYNRAKKGLRRAFKKYHDAIFVTITLPPTLPLVIRIPELNGFVLLQDSAISYVLKRLRQIIRYIWGKGVKVFTTYEYHEDGRLHIHVIIFGVKGVLDWNRLMGRKKEPALLYYARKLGIQLTRNLRKRPTRLAKFILTRLLDRYLIEFLENVDMYLGTHFLRAYLGYKEAKHIDGVVNEVHRIRDGKWVSSKPRDARGSNAVSYVLKYLLKMIRELQLRSLGLAKGLMKLKLLGYWVFGKRFYTYSKGLLPPPPKKNEEKPRYFVGIWRAIDLPEYIKPYYVCVTHTCG